MSSGPRPMFPLGTVLFPTVVLPLQIFEPRYQRLLEDVLEGDRRFGVVLIERGSEVGGGDVRTEVGTLAEVIEARDLADGHWAVAAVGRERLRVDRWLEDDPYPRAEVSVVEDGPDPAPDPGALEGPLRRALALQAELGEARAPVQVELSDDPGTATLQMGAVGPFGPADQQRILACTDAPSRHRLIGELLEEALPLLEARLGG